MRVIDLPLDGAQVAPPRLEEHARAVRSAPQQDRFVVRQIRGSFEQVHVVVGAFDAQLPPFERRVQRSVERRVDGDRPTRRAADTGVLAPVGRVEGKDVVHTQEPDVQPTPYSVRSAVVGFTVIARHAGIALESRATSVRSAGTVRNVAGSRGRT